MFSLMYGIYQYLSSKEEIKVLIVGLSKCGKTTFLESIKSLLLPKYTKPGLISPTIGMNLARLKWKDAELTVWDVGGTMRGIWEQYLGEADGLVFVVDASERARFEEVAATLGMLLARHDVDKIPIAVLANKQDVREAAKTEELMEAVCRPAGLLSSRREYRVFETAGGTGEGVREASEWLLEAARTFARTRPTKE